MDAFVLDSSMEETMVSRFLLISVADVEASLASMAELSEPLAIWLAMADSPVADASTELEFSATFFIIPWSFSIKVLNQPASSPISSWAWISILLVKSPSPWAISLRATIACRTGFTMISRHSR
jgi:hypothetical protein